MGRGIPFRSRMWKHSGTKEVTELREIPGLMASI